MPELHNAKTVGEYVKQLFDKGEIKLFIGYREGFGGVPRAAFLQSAANIDKLIFDERCKQNLITYFHKPEVKRFEKIGVMANVPALRTILQLASEHQIKEGDLRILTIAPDGKVIEFENFKEIEGYVADKIQPPPPPVKARYEQIMNMPLSERMAFWTEELSNCIKCYACRSACPMCYCTKCIVENNQPQWISTVPTVLGNLEWQIVRSMHLAGRCVGCGECSRACPVDIPLGLLNMRLAMEVAEDFGARAGMKADADYALSTFKVDDKENFIR
jgi:ferredoxin